MSLLIDIPSAEGDVRKDLEPGEYLFEVAPHKDPDKAISTFNKVGDDGGLTNEKETMYFNWPLQVVEGPDKGRFFYHRTMFWASPTKIAQAANVYDPFEAFTLSFLNDIGLCDVKGGKATIKAEFLGKTKEGKAALRMDKIYGRQFYGRLGFDKTGKYLNLTKAWVKKEAPVIKGEDLF
jgi:hypothetical protein